MNLLCLTYFIILLTAILLYYQCSCLIILLILLSIGYILIYYQNLNNCFISNDNLANNTPDIKKEYHHEQVNESVNEPTNKPVQVNEPTNEPVQVNKPVQVNEPVNEPVQVNKPVQVNEPVNTSESSDLLLESQVDSYASIPPSYGIKDFHTKMGCCADTRLFNRMKFMGIQPQWSKDIRAAWNKYSLQPYLEDELREHADRIWWNSDHLESEF